MYIVFMETKRFETKEKKMILYISEKADAPLIVLNDYKSDPSSIISRLIELDPPPFNLLAVGELRWHHDMSPWKCPAIHDGEPDFSGGADEYLELLTRRIIPKAYELIKGMPAFTGIAGYSLAGLFALYSMYKCDIFDRAASMSGSFWFPGFKDFVLNEKMIRMPDRIYLSLGDREAKTGNSLIGTVQNNTEEIASYLNEHRINTTFEMNPGNHFKDAAKRTAAGIYSILLP